MKKIYTDKAPQAIGPYSQAIISNGMLYSSGQIPINPNSGQIETHSIKEQTKQVCENLKAVLEKANLDFSNVVKTTCYLSNMENFAFFNEIYEIFFVSKPARSCFEVARLPKDSLVEIEIIAEINKPEILPL